MTEIAVRYPSFYIGLLADNKTLEQYDKTLDSVQKIDANMRPPNRRNPHISLFYGVGLGEEEIDLVYSTVAKVDESLRMEQIYLKGVKFGTDENGTPNIAYSVLRDPRPIREAHYFLKEELSPYINLKFVFSFDPHMTWVRIPSKEAVQQSFRQTKGDIENLLDEQRWQFHASGLFILAKDRVLGTGNKHCLAIPGNISSFKEYSERFEQVSQRAS